MPFVHPHFASRPPPVRKTKDLSSVKRVNKTRTERLVPRDDDKLPEEEVYSCCMNHTFSKCPDVLSANLQSKCPSINESILPCL